MCVCVIFSIAALVAESLGDQPVVGIDSGKPARVCLIDELPDEIGKECVGDLIRMKLSK